VGRNVSNTHRHGDNTHGNDLCPQADIVGHRLCRETLLRWGDDSLQAAKEATPELDEVRLRVPNLTFEREMSLYIGGMTLEMLYLPGHSIDGIGVLIRSERVLFSGDAIMPLPSFVWGDREQLMDSMQRVKAIPSRLSGVMAGAVHGPTILLPGPALSRTKSCAASVRAYRASICRLTSQRHEAGNVLYWRRFRERHRGGYSGPPYVSGCARGPVPILP